MLLAAALCLLAGSAQRSLLGQGVALDEGPEDEPDLIDAEAEPHRNPYCSVFADPADCEKEMQDGVYKTWNEDDVRQELWRTMKALAELELREHAHHAVHKAKAEEQRRMFTLFRKTMGREVMDVHALQEEMHAQHRSYMANLTRDLVFLAQDMKNYTDYNLEEVNGKTTSLSKVQEQDSQQALVQIAENVASTKAKIASLHAVIDAQSNTTQAFAAGVEAAMMSGDAALTQALDGVGSDLDAVDARERAHYGNASARLHAQVVRQDEEHQAVLAKTEQDVGALRVAAHGALDTERTAINDMLSAAMGEVRDKLAWLRGNLTARTDALNGQVDAMIAAQDANNSAQAAALAALRRDYEGNKSLAFARLDEDTTRLGQLSRTLVTVQQTLRAQSTADKALLVGTVDKRAAKLEEEATEAREAMATTVRRQNVTYHKLQEDLDAWRARMATQRRADVAQLNTQIDTMVANEAARLKTRVARDWGAWHARLEKEDAENSADTDKVKKAAADKHAAIVAEEQEFERLQTAVNAAHELELATLGRNLTTTAEVVGAKLAALRARHEDNKATLASVKAELSQIRMEDHKEVASRVAAKLAGLRTKLESEIQIAHTLMDTKMHADVKKLRHEMHVLKAMTSAEQDQLASDIGSLSLSLSLCLTHSLTLSLSLTHTNTHTHTQTHTHRHTHTHTPNTRVSVRARTHTQTHNTCIQMCRYEETDQGDIDHVLAGRSTKQEDVILKGETFLDGFLFVSLRVCLCAFFSVRVFQCARRVFVWLCVASSHTCVHAHRHAMCTGKLGVMLDGLAATRHKLTSELARIARRVTRQ